MQSTHAVNFSSGAVPLSLPLAACPAVPAPPRPLLLHPSAPTHLAPWTSAPPAAALLLQILWAFCVYLEAVSVLPQLRMMQKAKVVEKFTAHYVFALGLSRFISCAHWILQVGGVGGWVGGWVKVGGWGVFWCVPGAGTGDCLP